MQARKARKERRQPARPAHESHAGARVMICEVNSQRRGRGYPRSERAMERATRLPLARASVFLLPSGRANFRALVSPFLSGPQPHATAHWREISDQTSRNLLTWVNTNCQPSRVAQLLRRSAAHAAGPECLARVPLALRTASGSPQLPQASICFISASRRTIALAAGRRRTSTCGDTGSSTVPPLPVDGDSNSTPS